MRLAVTIVLLAFCLALVQASSFRAPEQKAIIHLPEVLLLSVENSDHHLFTTPSGDYTPFPPQKKQHQHE